MWVTKMLGTRKNRQLTSIAGITPGTSQHFKKVPGCKYNQKGSRQQSSDLHSVQAVSQQKQKRVQSCSATGATWSHSNQKDTGMPPQKHTNTMPPRTGSWGRHGGNTLSAANTGKSAAKECDHTKKSDYTQRNKDGST